MVICTYYKVAIAVYHLTALSSSLSTPVAMRTCKPSPPCDL
jgi:hypothetical protein